MSWYAFRNSENSIYIRSIVFTNKSISFKSPNAMYFLMIYDTVQMMNQCPGLASSRREITQAEWKFLSDADSSTIAKSSALKWSSTSIESGWPCCRFMRATKAFFVVKVWSVKPWQMRRANRPVWTPLITTRRLSVFVTLGCSSVIQCGSTTDTFFLYFPWILSSPFHSPPSKNIVCLV